VDVHTDAQITVSDLPQYRNITVSTQNTGQVGRRVTHGSVEGDCLATDRTDGPRHLCQCVNYEKTVRSILLDQTAADMQLTSCSTFLTDKTFSVS
jgi:hypothetical protein